MKLLTSKNLLGILVVGIVITFASSNAMAQGRGRRASNFDRKCGKFVNCHDARDGRWDGRGPNGRARYSDHYSRRTRRMRHRDRDYDRTIRHRRNRDRDFDRDRSWRGGR